METEIEQQRYIYYIPHFGRPIRVKDMPIDYIKKVIFKIREGQISENTNYSLPYLQYILEAELKVRPILHTFITDRILRTTFPNSKGWNIAYSQAVKDKVTNYYSKKLYYS